MVAPAIFLHSNWRSASTYVWAKFRGLPGTCCYYEPLNEQLATATAETVDNFRPWSFANHPPLDHPYFEEYRPLLAPEGGIEGFPADLVFARYRLDADDPAPPLQAYFDRLEGFARRQDKVPVFGLVRSTLRLGWFRRHRPGIHIFILRQPRRQFVSCLHQAVKGNFYFLERPWVILGNNRDDPALALLFAILCGPGGRIPAAADDAFWAARAHQAGPAEHFLISHVLHLLTMREVAAACDLVVDVDRLGGDTAAIAETERRIAQLTGAVVSLADCRPPLYDGNLDWSADAFAGLEGLAEDVLAATPSPSPGPLLDLATRFRHGGLSGCAERLYRMVLEIEPSHFDALLGLAVAARERNGYGEADRLLRRALADRPASVAALLEHGRVLWTLRKFAEAAECFRQALALEPGSAEAHNGLGVACITLDQLDEAQAHLAIAVALAPARPQFHVCLGCALMRLQRPDQALDRFDAALALRPDDPDTLHNRSDALVELGRFDAAAAAIERAITLAPARPVFYRSLGEVRRFTTDDPYLAAMERLAADVDAFAFDDRIDLHFALAKALEDTGESGRAFDHLLRGNALKRRQTPYDEAAVLDEFQRIQRVFSADMLRSRADFGAESDRPVFIVGMPRSGSTLVEQILAGHPEVFAAGEVDTFGQATAILGELRFPDDAAAITADQARLMGRHYLDATAALAPAARRVTDKMLGNFRLIGLIRLALPGARIIHTRRHPLDTCVSCFAAPFTGHQPFTYDLGELGRYYRAYAALMEHWRRVLPEGVLLDVDYEAVVADLDGQARRLLAFCGLSWDPACLAFHQAKRPVRTRSRVQVRQPLYGSSVGRWQVYGDRLEPLVAALDSRSP